MVAYNFNNCCKYQLFLWDFPCMILTVSNENGKIFSEIVMQPSMVILSSKHIKYMFL